MLNGYRHFVILGGYRYFIVTYYLCYSNTIICFSLFCCDVYFGVNDSIDKTYSIK